MSKLTDHKPSRTIWKKFLEYIFHGNASWRIFILALLEVVIVFFLPASLSPFFDATFVMCTTAATLIIIFMAMCQIIYNTKGLNWIMQFITVLLCLGVFNIITLSSMMIRDFGRDDAAFSSLGIEVVAIGITLLTIAGGWYAMSFKKRMLIIQDNSDKSLQTFLDTAEIAIGSLPSFEESQQIPISCTESLKSITDRIFSGPDKRILQYLNESGNGAILRLARACYYYGSSEYTQARSTLQEALQNEIHLDFKQRRRILYCLGIIHRQMQEYDQSLETFKKLIRDSLGHDDIQYEHYALVGFAITIRAAWVDGYFTETDNISHCVKKHIDPVMKLIHCKCQFGIDATTEILTNAFYILKYVVDSNIHYLNAMVYLTKLGEDKDTTNNYLVKRLPGVQVIVDYCRVSALDYLTRMEIKEDVNMELNYCISRAYLHYYNFLQTKDENSRKSASRELEKAIRLTNSIENVYPKIQVYSEVLEYQVSPDDIRKQDIAQLKKILETV